MAIFFYLIDGGSKQSKEFLCQPPQPHRSFLVIGVAGAKVLWYSTGMY